MADPSSSSSSSAAATQQNKDMAPHSPGNSQHGNSRFAYTYAVFGGDEGIHPEMGPAIFLARWQIMGTVADTWAVMAVMKMTKLESKIGPDCFMIYVAVILASMFTLLLWCFPPELPRLGSARKIMLEMVALQAAVLAKHFPRPSEGHYLVFQLLICLTTSIYVHMKHGFAVFDINVGDVLLVVLAQSLIYWAPYWGSALFYVCFLGYRFWTSGKNTTGRKLSADQEHVHKAIEESPATEEISSEEEKDCQFREKEFELLAITIATSEDNAQSVSSAATTTTTR